MVSHGHTVLEARGERKPAWSIVSGMAAFSHIDGNPAETALVMSAARARTAR